MGIYPLSSEMQVHILSEPITVNSPFIHDFSPSPSPRTQFYDWWRFFDPGYHHDYHSSYPNSGLCS